MRQIITYTLWQSIWQDAVRGAAARGARLVLILGLFWLGRSLLFRFIDSALARLALRQAQESVGEERANRLRTLQGLVKSIVNYVLLFVLLVMVLHALGVDVTGIITTAGVGGIAFGFGAQKLVKDIIAGFFIIVEDQFAVGEYVTLQYTVVLSATGVVENIGMRTTILRDDAGKLLIISNGDIAVVTNQSRSPVDGFIEVGVAGTADISVVTAIIEEVGVQLLTSAQIGLTKPVTVSGITEYDGVHTKLRLVILTDPRRLANAQLVVRTLVRQRLLERNIELG